MDKKKCSKGCFTRDFRLSQLPQRFRNDRLEWHKAQAATKGPVYCDNLTEHPSMFLRNQLRNRKQSLILNLLTATHRLEAIAAR